MVMAIVIAKMPAPKVQGKQVAIIVGLFFIIMVGLRYEVGGDWGTYKQHLALMRGMSLTESLTRGDPGYFFLNWAASRLNLDIAFVNLVCALVVVLGLMRFCREQPYPWLAFLVAIPYFLFVVSMGYTRQATALGFAMIALSELANERSRKFVFWILVGALFHKSAVMLLPIAALSTSKNRVWTTIWVGAVGFIAVNLFLLESANDLWQNYVEEDYQSQGGLIRVAMNAVPSVIFLLARNRLSKNATERRLWSWIAIFSLATVPLVFIASTAVDRVALYFIPIQLFVFSRIPFLALDAGSFKLITVGVICYYALVLFVWLSFAANAFAWLPYDNYLFYGLQPPKTIVPGCPGCFEFR